MLTIERSDDSLFRICLDGECAFVKNSREGFDKELELKAKVRLREFESQSDIC